MNTLRPTPIRWPEEPSSEQAQAQAREPRAAERGLIESAQRGDQQAFSNLVRRHQRHVFSVIAQLLRQPNEVEDIAQQVFLKVHRSLHRFNFQAAFSTWLHRIVVNECYDHLRRQRAQKAGRGHELAVEDMAELDRLSAPAAATRPDVARRLELRQTVEQLFRRLPVDDRMLLALRELEGFSMEEIARVLNLKENTVKVRLFRARKRLLELHRRSLQAARAKQRGTR